MKFAILVLLLGTAGGLAAQDDGVDAATVSAQRCAELVAQQQAATLDVPTVLAALGDADDDVRRTAAAIVRHQWTELPPALFTGLGDDATAARALVRELALAPRPAATTWIEQWAQAQLGRTDDDRCYALAAIGEPLTSKQAQPLVDLLPQPETPGWRAAVGLVPARVADGLVGKLHAGLLQTAFDVDRIAPLLDRMSDVGMRQLLGLVATLPPGVAKSLCVLVQDRAPSMVAERVAAALDDGTPLDLVWLRYSGPLLDRPARVDRVLALLVDRQADGEVQEVAFRALVEAKVVDGRVLDFATADVDASVERVRRLLAQCIDSVPAARLLRWLDGDERLSTLVVQRLSARRVLEPELEQRLLRQVTEMSTVDGTFCHPATMALLQHGGAESLQHLWPLLRGNPALPEFLGSLVGRRAPFVHEQLLAEMVVTVPDVAAEARRGQLDEFALALIALGDRRELERLVVDAPHSSAGFVRRCALRANPVPAASARTLLAAAVGSKAVDPEIAVELAAWAATCDDPDVMAALHRLWREPPAGDLGAELREVAMHALVAGPYRAGMVDELRAALASGPLSDAQEALAFELVSTMPTPLVRDDLSLAVDLLLLRPRTDPDREARLMQRWPDGRSGFPLVAAVAQRLRGTDVGAAAAAFTEGVRRTLADPRYRSIAPVRLPVLWRALAVEPAMQLAVGAATSPLALQLCTGELRPMAEWFAMHAAANAGDFAAARDHAVLALPLVTLPAERNNARVLLGERDPESGRDPWAALAAAPCVFERRLAAARGDAAKVVRCEHCLREFAGHDRATLSLLSNVSVEPAK